ADVEIKIWDEESEDGFMKNWLAWTALAAKGMEFTGAKNIRGRDVSKLQPICTWNMATGPVTPLRLGIFDAF
ncbi:MAG: hypothetical protein Q9228_002408, partial [Teloschistes exilis]